MVLILVSTLSVVQIDQHVCQTGVKLVFNFLHLVLLPATILAIRILACLTLILLRLLVVLLACRLV